MYHEKSTKSGSLRLGEHRLDLGRVELTDTDGQIVRMRKQSLDVLVTLAESAGEVVSKDEIISRVWAGVATTDDSLVQCIADIRRVLGRDAIETFPKKGYRLAPDTAQPGKPPARRLGSWLLPTGLLAAAALVGAFALAPDTPDDTTPVVPPDIEAGKTLAVLPFANLGADSDLRFFSDGLSEDLITDLSKVPGLTVISQASSFDFRDAESGFGDIAAALGVRYLVRGTVRHEGERVRINVSLVDPRDGFNLWSDRFDRRLGDTFGLQEEVTRHIVDALSLTLRREDDDAPRIEPDAYFMQLRGLEALQDSSPEGNREARQFFERAVRLDPQYARAHASIALTYGRDAASGAGQAAAVEKGLQEAILAIQLEPENPHAYYALGVLNLAIGEHDQALAAARHAIGLDANFSDGYALLAETGVQTSGLDEAARAIDRAKLLHPRHGPDYDWIDAQIRYQLGDDNAAATLLDAVLTRRPDFLDAQLLLAAASARRGDGDRADRALQTARRLAPNLTRDTALRAFSAHLPDRRDRIADGLAMAGLTP